MKNYFEILNSSEIEKIDYFSRRILREKGILIPCEEVKDLLKKRGLKFDGSIAKFSSKIINKALSIVPEKIKIHNRELSYSLDLESKSHYASGHNGIYLFRSDTNERVPIKKREVGNFALISDYLDDIDIVGIEAYPQDVKPKSAVLHGLESVLINTEKPVYFSPETFEEVEYLIRILKTVSDNLIDYPIGICQLSPHSPLAWDEKTIKALVCLAENRFPTVVLPAPFSFMTAPITVAGEIIQVNSELLSSLVITQLINPGAPFIYGNAMCTADIETGQYLVSAPESNLFRSASAQLARFYKIPSHSIGPDTDANILDMQNSFEKAISLFAESIAGTNIIINSGMFGTGLTVSYEQLLIDSEMIRFIKRFIRGIDTSEEKLAFESLMNVTHSKDFITDSLTLKYLRSDEHIRPLISNRGNYQNWIKDGSKDIIKNAEEKIINILKDHKPKLLDKNCQKEISRIIKEFESKYNN